MIVVLINQRQIRIFAIFLVERFSAYSLLNALEELFNYLKLILID